MRPDVTNPVMSLISSLEEQPFSLVPVSNYYYFFYSCDDKRLKYSTGVTVASASLPENIKRLEDIADEMKTYIQIYSANRKPVCHDEFKALLDGIFNAEKTAKRAAKHLAVITGDLVADHKKWIEAMRKGEITKKDGTLLSKNSIDQYERMRNRWETCAEETKHDPKYRFILSYNITADDCKKMLTWLNKKNYSRNAIYDIFNNLKIYLKWAHGKGLHSNEMYKTLQETLNIRPEPSDAIAPTYDEIYQLYRTEFDNPNEERARDFFVLGCFLGLRVNDLRTINNYKLHWNPEGYHEFEIFTQKTTQTVQIPAHWIAVEIYNKYRGPQVTGEYGPFAPGRVPKQWRKLYKTGLLPVFHKNNLAQYLPRICKEVITGTKLITMTKGGVKSATHYDRWNLISPHTMRRFFATYMHCDLGIEAAEVMIFTGHKTVESFFKYIKVDRRKVVKKVALLVAFQRPVQSSSDLAVVA